MDEKSMFDRLFNNRREEEKSYYFLEDDDEEKITFNHGHNRFEYELSCCEPDEDCSDCDKECKSQILAELRTNDSNCHIWDQYEDEKEDIKYLMQLGLLEIVDENNMFNVNEKFPSSPFESCDDLNRDYFETEIPSHQKIDKKSQSLFKMVESSLDPAAMLSMKEKELMLEGLPRLEIIDDTEHDVHTNHETHENHLISYTRTHSLNSRIEDVGEEEIDTTRQDKKKSTEYNNILTRKLFRMLRKYFKSTFENFAAPFQYKTKIKIMNPEEMDTLVFQYIKREFDILSEYFTASDLPMLILGLKQIILSDRYNKCDRATYGIDFELIRNLFNKCSKRTLDEFITVPSYCLLFVHFYLKQGRHLVCKQQDVDKRKLQERIESLVKIMYCNLPLKFQELYSFILSSLIPS